MRVLILRVLLPGEVHFGGDGCRLKEIDPGPGTEGGGEARLHLLGDLAKVASTGPSDFKT